MKTVQAIIETHGGLKALRNDYIKVGAFSKRQSTPIRKERTENKRSLNVFWSLPDLVGLA